jgi:hypothetical protein
MEDQYGLAPPPRAKEKRGGWGAMVFGQAGRRALVPGNGSDMGKEC